MNQILELLKKTRVTIAPENFFLISFRHEDWRRMLENPALSPRGTAPFMLLQDKFEVTLLLDEIDFKNIQQSGTDLLVEADFRLVTFEIELDWKTIGFLAFVTKILAEGGVSVGAISAFSRDHLLIKQEELPKALKILGEYVEELC